MPSEGTQTRRTKFGVEQRSAADGHPEGVNPPGSYHWWTAEMEETQGISFYNIHYRPSMMELS